jgi:hypothetical protein
MSILNDRKNSSDLEASANGGCFKIEETQINNATAFNRLLELQLLIQKHSGLKELCKKINLIKFYL